MTEPAIRVERVAKKFARSLKRAMTYGLIDIARAALIPHRFRSPEFRARAAGAAPAPELPPLRPTEFWALRDVSFTVAPGECVGLIGANGAGKSTMFSILSGIYGPTRGRAEVRGRLQALIALGAGFHPLLSGRENIYINAAILGMTTRQIDALSEAIIDFAGLADFIDAPVKTYSSGMLVRLGFSIAAHVDPDVLLIDEVLAVGDAEFQRKCTDFSLRLANSGKTIMTVSHNPVFIQTMCRRVIWLDHGQVRAEGETYAVIERYRAEVAERAWRQFAGATAPPEALPLHLREVSWVGGAAALAAGAPAELEIRGEALAAVPCARLWVQLFMLERADAVAGFSMYDDGHGLRCEPGAFRVGVRIPALSLRAGHRYLARVGVRDPLCNAKLAETFQTRPFGVHAAPAPCDNGIGSQVRLDATGAAVSMPYGWDVAGSAQLTS